MKKFFILLLASIMLLTACGETLPEITSSEMPSTDDASDVTSEDPKYELKGNRTLISVGKPYTLASPAHNDYPDIFNQQLTDGIKIPDVGAHYTDIRTVGFSPAHCDATIDLGDEGRNITEVVARSLELHTDGVGLAKRAVVSGSNDGETFTELGEAKFTEARDQSMQSVSIKFEKPVDYRYIRVVVERNPRWVFVFVDEIEIYADVVPDEKVDTVTLSYQNENIDRAAWKELSKGKAATPVSIKNIALNQEYTFKNCKFDSRAPKDEKALTDAARTKMLFGQKGWVGIGGNGEDAPSITMKLNSRYANIYSFNVYALGAGLNVKYPDYIDVYASNDNGKSYHLLGRMYAPQDCEHYTYTLKMPEYIEARFIRFEFPVEEAYYWIEEIEINVGYNEPKDDKIYPDLCFPTVTEDSYWDASDVDFNTKQNLLIGANQQVAAMRHNSTSVLAPHHVKNSPFDFEGLADGKRASTTNCYGGEYFFSYNTTTGNVGYSNCLDFFYDIGKLSTIEELNVHLLEQEASGITRPSFITVYLSEDGDHWYQVGNYTLSQDEVLNAEPTQLSFNFPLETPYAARFVRFRVEEPKNPQFIFIDELEALGTKAIADGVKKISESGIKSVIYYTNDERAEYVSTENSTVNSQHQILYIPDYGDESTLLPMVAHLDENGKITDTMFDGFICWGALSYPTPGVKGYTESFMADWYHLYDITFNGVNGLDRLDEVVGQVKEALNIPDYTVKVYISTLTLHDTVTDFGDVDGDGVSENMTIEADRKKVIDWYLKLYTDEFAKRNYKNIVFDGVNYIDESIHLEKDNSHVVKEIGEAVKAIGVNYIWIPYYAACRFYIGNDLDFDAVCMQMNYVFTNDAPEWRVSSTAEMTKRLGMSIEMEHSYQCFGDKNYTRQYLKYLLAGVNYGFIEGIHMYYADRDNFSVMGYSDDPLCRMQYDYTYHYIKGDLDITPDAREALKLSTAKDTLLRGSFNEEKKLELYTILKQPEHGIVSLNEEGDFVYYPEKGYTGTDSFSYTYNEYLGESDECVVEITVG